MAARLIRRSVQKLKAYVPGEQPKIRGLIKLNTNENPYPPAPAVLKAVRGATDGRLRLYPNPTSQALRERLARLHRCAPENIMVGNGSDELLALACRAFVDPVAPGARQTGRNIVQYFTPSYSLYPVLADIHDAAKAEYPLEPDFALPPIRRLKRDPRFKKQAALTFITTPNAPSGHGYAAAQLETVCALLQGVVVLDETYVDCAPQNALLLALRRRNVLVSRTFSKAFSLCFLRIGYFVGHPELIQALDKIRDSYNVNGLGQVAALATLDHLPYYQRNFEKILQTREWLSAELQKLNFTVFPSQTNFLLARPPGPPASRWLAALREQKILVRWFDQDPIRSFLRITIGARSEAAALVRAAKKIISAGL